MKKLNLKTKSLYIGMYEDENESAGNWHTFIYGSNAGDAELQKYFRRVVYKSEYDVKLDPLTRIDIYELREGYDYTAKKHSRIAVLPAHDPRTCENSVPCVDCEA